MSHTAELIAVGTELLLGNIANTDAQMLSEGLSTLGINVYYHTVVGDNPARLKEALDALEIPLELHCYFLEPTVFLSSATQYTRMDRINEAIGQVEKLQRKVTEFRKQLEESL